MLAAVPGLVQISRSCGEILTFRFRRVPKKCLYCSENFQQDSDDSGELGFSDYIGSRRSDKVNLEK